MAIKLVVKGNGTQLWLSFGDNATICLHKVAEERSRIIKNNMLNSINKYLEIHKMATEIDVLLSDNINHDFQKDHPIYKMFEEINELKAEIRRLGNTIKGLQEERKVYDIIDKYLLSKTKEDSPATKTPT